MNENAPRWYEPAFPPPPSYFAWPFIALAAAGEALAVQANEVARALSAAGAQADPSPKFAWSATNRVRLEMSTMELRDFSHAAQGVPTLVCAPLALHGATIADLAPGHSLVDALVRQRLLFACSSPTGARRARTCGCSPSTVASPI